MLKEFRADLHIHTCLSPCSDIEMSPFRVVQKAAESNLDIIAITDHNSAENIEAAVKSAESLNLTVLTGMEITSSEEAHIIALFDNTEHTLKLQDIVYSNTVDGENNEKLFGEQIIANEKDEVLGFNRRLLIGATKMTADSIVSEIHALNGLAIACHIDRQAFSIISQLGFIPDNISFDALELSSAINREEALKLYGEYESISWISSSDAHRPGEIGRRATIFYMNDPTIDEMRMALHRVNSRKVEW